jgi:long-chain acyl-CoA synthetase
VTCHEPSNFRFGTVGKPLPTIGVRIGEDSEIQVRDQRVVSLFRERIDARSGDLARFEEIKRFTLLPRELTVQGGEIAPTMKVRRRAVEARHAELIEAMYR